MHRLPRLSQTIQSPIVQSAKSRSCATGSQLRARNFSWAPSPAPVLQTTFRKNPYYSQEGTATGRPLRNIPIVAPDVPTNNDMPGACMKGRGTSRYARALDGKLRSMEIDESLRYLQSELGALMVRYHKSRAMQRRHVGFEEDLLAVEKVIMGRQQLLTARISKLEARKDGRHGASTEKTGGFWSRWGKTRPRIKSTSVRNFVL
ncbi:hypothetical protein F4810DRAFT_211002 [Camillea tinctor]|nr:hypothetical protein F4810DRAFT_211002 [Camillea tinctor]